MPAVSHDIDRVAVSFDDDNVVADAGLLLVGTLARHLGLGTVTDEVCTVGYRPGRKLSTLVTSLVAGGTCIDDIDALRAGATARVVGHDTVASTTVGHWLRGVSFGHVRQLDRVAETMLTRAWAAGAGPGDGLLVIDVDSTIVEVHGKTKQGAAYGYTKQLSLHPLLAVRADTGEVLHVRTRTGSANTARGAVRFVAETHGRVRRAGATGPVLWRFDSGFWNNELMELIEGYGGAFTVGIRLQKPIAAAIATIDDDAWVDIEGYIGARPGRRDRLPRPSPGRASHPQRGRPAHHVRGLAPPRVPHQPSRRPARGRPDPPCACGRGARDPRPQARCRDGPHALGDLPGQRRLGHRLHPRAQPRALDPAAHQR
jgi:hypothetical protein